MEMQKLRFWQGNFLNLPISLAILHPPSFENSKAGRSLQLPNGHVFLFVI